MTKDELRELLGSRESVEFRAKTQSACYEMATSLCYLDAINFDDYEREGADPDFNTRMTRRVRMLAVLLMANVEKSDQPKRIVDPDYIGPRLNALRAGVEHMISHFRLIPSDVRPTQAVGLTQALNILANNIYQYEAFMEESLGYLSSLSGVNDAISGAMDPSRKKNLSIVANFESWRERNSEHLGDLSGNHKSLQAERMVADLEETMGDSRDMLHNEDLLRAHLPQRVKETVAESMAQKESSSNQPQARALAQQQNKNLFSDIETKESANKGALMPKKSELFVPVSSASQLMDLDELLEDSSSESDSAPRI